MALAGGIAAPAAMAADPVPVGPSPAPVGDNPEVHWSDRLMLLMELMCRILGCGESSQSMDPALAAAINRLSLTVLSGGVPTLGDKDREILMSAALEAAVISDAHAQSMDPLAYTTLNNTLDTIVAELESGRRQ